MALTLHNQYESRCNEA